MTHVKFCVFETGITFLAIYNYNVLIYSKKSSALSMFFASSGTKSKYFLVQWQWIIKQSLI